MNNENKSQSDKDMYCRNWGNSITLSGIIRNKPIINVYKAKNGQETKTANFIIYQPHHFEDKREYEDKFYCKTYSQEAIEILEKMTNQSIVVILGMLAKQSKQLPNGKYDIRRVPQATEIRITDTLWETLIESERDSEGKMLPPKKE